MFGCTHTNALPGQQSVVEPSKKSFYTENEQEIEEHLKGARSKQLSLISGEDPYPCSTNGKNSKKKTSSTVHHYDLNSCPLLSECDWQLGQLVRCIHLNKDISGCQMFSDAWKDCKKKAARKVLQHAYK